MYKDCLKRFFDLVVGLSFLPFFVILAIPISLIIKLDSSGPIFFRQKRAGRNGKYFNILKFRSMSSCSISEKKEFEPGEKKRITRFGAFLRKSKLDEIPQIINVILGDMSLVGPRPEVKKYIEKSPERWQKILSIRPGITDPASISFRNEEEILAASSDPEKEYIENIMPTKLSLYEKYLTEISFTHDVKILLSTILTLFIK